MTDPLTETDHSAVVHLDAETLAPIGVSKPCPSSTVAYLGFGNQHGVRIPCGLLAGHYPDTDHEYRIAWRDPGDGTPGAPGLRQRMEATQKPIRRPR